MTQTTTRKEIDAFWQQVTHGTRMTCLANTYNHIPRPAVVAVRDGVARVIMRRETEEDLFLLDVG